MFQAIVLGLFQGATYAMLAVGLVLVYKGAKVFNFAQGEFGTLAVYVTWCMLGYQHLPYWLAAVIGLSCAVALGMVMERLIVRPLMGRSRITLLVATVGVALAVIQTTLIVAEPKPQNLDVAVNGNPTVIGQVGILPQQWLLIGVLAAVGILLALFLRTDYGHAVTATSQDAFASRVVGISVPAVSRIIWGSAGLLGGLAGLLQAPITGSFYPGYLTITGLIPAFTAAVIGGMDSLAGAFVGGLAVGVVQSVGQYQLQLKAGIPGGSGLVVFAMLIIVLMVRPRGLLGKEVAA
ncbi:MAG TPA: branched-chain amino acid ABC transporter permease [Actinomycetota bacterium]